MQALAQMMHRIISQTQLAMSIGGSSDPAIVGKVIRSELRPMVARSCDGPFNLAQQGSGIMAPFSSVTGRVYNGAAAAEDRAMLESNPSAARRQCLGAELSSDGSARGFS